MTGTAIEKFKEEEKIRVSLLRHRGDILTVVNETGLDLQYVKRVASKIKKNQRRDVDRLVANDIAQLILSGAEQREHVYLTYLNSLEGKETARVSLCHGVPVKDFSFDDTSYYNCLKCGRTCGTKVIENMAIHNLVLRYNEQLREEAKFLIEFADKMGFTNKVTLPSTKITQYNIAMGGRGDGIDKEILSDVSKLTGPERQQLRRKLEQQIIESEFEDDKKSKKKQ